MDFSGKDKGVVRVIVLAFALLILVGLLEEIEAGAKAIGSFFHRLGLRLTGHEV